MLRPCRSIALRVLYAAQIAITPTMTKIAPNTQVVRSIQSLVTDTGGSSATLMGCCAFGLFALSRRCSFGEESRALAGDDDLAAGALFSEILGRTSSSAPLALLRVCLWTVGPDLPTAK